MFTAGDVFKIGIPIEAQTVAVTPQKASTKREEKPRQKTEEELLKMIKKEPQITVKKLASKIRLTRRGIKYHIIKLKEQGRLKRIGSTKSGHWEVIKK